MNCDDPESAVLEQLRALAEADRGASAPPEVEAALVAAFRRRHRAAPRVRPRWTVWAAAAAAIALAFVVGRWTAEPVRPPAPEPAQAEVVTRFFPLAPGVDLSAAENAPRLRVRLPRTVLASFGLPVSTERLDEPVEADIVVGEDGIARAIRFVRPLRLDVKQY